MTDRPIIFSAPMVRALLAGRKLQTRRLATSPLSRCAVGDRLYVREAFFPRPGLPATIAVPRYRANEDRPEWSVLWKPSIHMPRWASRMTLIVDAIRIEPLQEIAEADAEAEGAVCYNADGIDVWYVPGAGIPHTATAKDCFAGLWNSLHRAEGERWGDNPQVVALTFRVEHTNIDRIAV